MNTLIKHTQNLIGLALLSLSLAGQAVAADGTPPTSECPQPRFTGAVPPDYLSRTNPLTIDEATLAVGESLFTGKSSSLPCAICHGAKGNGKGALASQYDPRPRNFT